VTPELEQKTELLLEAEADLNFLVSRFRETEAELGGLRTFCGTLLSEPALSLRRTYCARKSSELNATDAQLRAQIQVQEENIREMQLDIQRLQNPQG